jgi:hypothetical protein
LGKLGRPHILRTGQDAFGKCGQLLFLLGKGNLFRLLSTGGKAAVLLDGLEDVAQVSAHQECQQAYNKDTAKSKSGFGTAGKAPAVIHVRTFPSSV